MQRFPFALFLLFVVGFGHAFEDAATAVGASQYHRLIRDSFPRQAATDPLLSQAEGYARQRLWDEAIGQYEAAIAAGADGTALWIALSRVWRSKKDATSQERALQAAYNAYRGAKTATDQARALFLLGTLYDRRQQPKLALAAFKEGLGARDDVKIAKRYRELVKLTAFQVKGVQVESDTAHPQICLRFSDKLAQDIHYEDYLRIDPPIQAAMTAQERRLCVTGVNHGKSYELTLRSGLPAASGEKIETTETFTAQVPNRKPVLGFRGATYILPKMGGQQLPLSSVNVATVRLQLLRINDRNLTEQINRRRIAQTLGGYDIEAIAEQSGELLWQGELATGGALNQETTTGIPVGDFLKNTEPGIYVIAAEPADRAPARYAKRATQWLVVSDLGLTVFQGEDGLHGFVRSLDNAQPLAGVELRLYARNNRELGGLVSDANGYVRFDPGLLRGGGGREPAALMAYGRDGDFNFLDLARPAFDLSDRGVAGRAAPGPIDAFLYSDRGVYRPGETVELMVLVRDSRAEALEDLPLTLKIVRPDQVELEQIPLTGNLLGGYPARVPLAGNARTGTWTVRAYGDPEGEPVGQLTFKVEDFVPQTLKLTLTPQGEMLKPGQTMAVDANGRFLYGAPAANLKATAELVLREDSNPYPMHEGYRFGLIQESWQARRFPLELAGTDAQGQAQVNLKLEESPDINRPLKAVLRVSLFEPGGRPLNRSLSLPYRVQPFAIGVRPQFPGEGIQLGQEAAFQVIAVDPAGQRLEVNGLRYELFRENYDYYWYYRNNRWDYKLIVRDGEALAREDLNLGAEQPSLLTEGGLDWGSYRLEVHDPETGVATSVRFRVGWFETPSAGGAPDRLRITLDKPRYGVGETARVRVEAPFSGEALLTVAGDRLWTSRTFHLPAEGATLELPVSADWGPGVYLTATAFRPARNPNQRGPGRAIGVTWLGLDPQPRTLEVRLEAPKELTPRQTFELSVTVVGVEPGQPAFLTVAAVDEGILRLTDFVSPNPADYFLGKRRLGMDIRDLYGQLIETGGRPGQIRGGGDADGRQLEGTGVRTYKTVALFSGPVFLDAQGRARIPLELPDFNGQLRLMAVAWDRTRLGQEEASLLVRDPLVARAYLPRFLAPDDVGRLTLGVQNLSAPAGDYRIRLTGAGAVALEGETEFDFSVTDSTVQHSERRHLLLRGLEPGVGRIQMQIAGPQGFDLAREWEIPVRPAQPIATDRLVQRLPPGETLEVDDDLLNAYLPDTGGMRLSFASRPNLGVNGLLAKLNRYPYGCLEQTVSTALPLLYFNRTARVWGGEHADEMALRNRVQKAISRLLAMQRYDGGFGLWNADSPGESWLSAYTMDFFSRAKSQGYLVPAAPYERGLKQLEQRLNDSGTDADSLASRAYALYVLARLERAPIGELRYLHDNFLTKLPSVLAQAQLGAALARYGESSRAEEAFAAAMRSRSERWDGRDYGSPLRDRAALLALLAEAGLMARDIPPLAEELAADLNQRLDTSTQEQAWLLLAAHALLQEPGVLRLSIDGEPTPPGADPYYLAPTLEALEQGLEVTNQGERPVWYVANLSGVPAGTLPPAERGFTVTRRLYTRTGQEVDLARIEQNALLVAVITGKAEGKDPRQALIVDLLPAGLEIENARLVHNESAEDIRWLPKLSPTLHTEMRDDRFVAALDLGPDRREFAVAYLVRAVTPGDYRAPAVFVEDMYKPWYFGRGAMGTMGIE